MPEPTRADPITGDLVTETFEYDGGRQVTVYVPPDPPEALVFAGDGQLTSQWGVVSDVRRWVDAHFGFALPPERTAVCGVSASGELSLALGLRHPDVYGAVFSASPGGGFRPPPLLPSALPRTYLVAGTLEPFFLEIRRWAAS